MTTTLGAAGAVLPIPQGEIHVRPYRSGSNSQLKLSFTPRVSSLNKENLRSQTDEFRGFFTLFWISLGLLFLRTVVQSWEENRTPLSWTFGRLITGDVIVLAFADFLMSVSMFLCVTLIKLVQNGHIRFHPTGLIIQHTFQTLYLATAIWWGYHRQWYWVQSGFLVLHCLANLMKMHSYMAHNGMLSMVHDRLQEEQATLDQLVDSLPGGREAVLAEAAAHQVEIETKVKAEITPVATPAVSLPGTPSITGMPTTNGLTSYEDPAEAVKRHMGLRSETALVTARNTSPEKGSPGPELRKRNAKAAKKSLEALPEPQADLPQGTSLEPSHTTTPHARKPPHPLAWSSHERVALLAQNISAMQEELRSNGAKGLVWPQNVTYRHFFEYIFTPTLVYQLEYPRTNTIRPLVVLEKIIATFGTFSLIYTITEHYIIPFTPKPGDSLFKSYVNLALPMIINYLFSIIFECVCTGFAELSYFADREFYQDWWNSTTWDQFSRKWNKPVHTFLLRHVYASTMDSLSLSKTSATFVTFLLSALCHELVMAVVTKKIRPYLFLMQMAQLPMIALGRVGWVKRSKTIGNIVFWLGLMSGFPLL
ncbi:hypothetical protein TREMEDRAFT_34263 [Tremella mesenterica DSM 1558]|uniref:uncharacterized protein n=1 Tax=Tremella mesenterica (strain ATCC 24925 / CBS 8224 / DSM 1558 / NBRC 9311 / NRRL Y-6157 / RJB 2259-6 / UBC 559-6) TaxID=578456 RepID=UPI0003F491D2|nr:uncharacterized protein TREMEDRAFT_34263 [Tremella mesenterica DSM 1558]EIW67053.1 hypothetical protein TREMEDRAFT_34263 [Tremella mesenterica DSM 1558]